MCKFSYPLEIIPKAEYRKDGFSLDSILVDYPDICISRRVDEAIKDYIDNDEGRPHLDTDCFGEYYVHLSVNLMNSLFKNEYIKFCATGEAGKPWNGNAIKLEDYLVHIKVNETASAVFYKIGALHNRKFKKPLSLEKDPYNAMKEALKAHALQAFDGKNERQDVDFNGYVGVDHVPVNMNYWHCQVEIYPKDSDQELKNDKSWRKEIFIHVMNNILAYDFLTTAESDFVIDSKHYIA